MLAWLRRHVRMQNELARIHAEFVVRSNLQGVLGTRRKIHRCDVKAWGLNDCQPGGNQRLLQRRMRVDMQTIGDAEVKINLYRVARGYSYALGVEELDRRRSIASRAGAPRQRQWLIFDHLPPRAGRAKTRRNSND